ncbi:hypothetical protein GCM10010109_17450 [Actinoplanes campanulatus]|nr:hypothetical protein GCM10010109_17450 [Actinoplanes campanulatus]GID36251.1 hypothetical protein Aca09nite_27570 [Actinoplanes campanulatus]
MISTRRPSTLGCGASTEGPVALIRASSKAMAYARGAPRIIQRVPAARPARTPTTRLIAIDQRACPPVSGPRGVHRAAATPQATGTTTARNLFMPGSMEPRPVHTDRTAGGGRALLW